jgi:hypothetical protein
MNTITAAGENLRVIGTSKMTVLGTFRTMPDVQLGSAMRIKAEIIDALSCWRGSYGLSCCKTPHPDRVYAIRTLLKCGDRTYRSLSRRTARRADIKLLVKPSK